MTSIDFILNYDIIVQDMKTCFFNLFIAISTLVGAIGCATSNPKPPVHVAEEDSSDTESGGRWVPDRGGEKKASPSTEPSTVATNVATVSTNNLQLSQQSWKVTGKVPNPGFQPEQVYTSVPVPQEPQNKGFWARFWGPPSMPMLTDGIDRSSLPANPVRRSEGSFTLPTMWGTYNSSYSRGTDTYAESSWDENGPRRVFRQTIHNTGVASFYPERRRWVAPTYYQYNGSQGTITWP